MLEWKDNKSLKNHLSKHVLEEGKTKKEEQNIWKNNFDSIKYYLNLNNIDLLIKEYKTISQKNTENTAHYLYKDTSSQSFSINYYNTFYDHYLTTCTRYIEKNLKIFSCYFKDKYKTNLEIFLSVNNLCFKDIETKSMIIKNFRIYLPDNIINEIYLHASIKSNIQDPTKSKNELLLIYKVCIIIEYLKYLRKKQIDLYNKKKTKIKNILLFDMLSKIFEYKYNLLIGKKITWTGFSEKENDEIKHLESDITRIMSNEDLYYEDKIFTDLLAEFVNLFNYMNKCNKIIPIKDNLWKEMFIEFR